MKKTRTYTMRARADAAQQTRERIMSATLELSYEKPIAAIVLPDIAERAGVSVQTVLRQFGSRDGLFDSVHESMRARITDERRSPPSDVAAAVRIIMDHYDIHGDGVIGLLAQERWDERVATITANGRAVHRTWVLEAFGPLFADRAPAERDELTDLLVVATDVYTWKLLRRDRDLDRSVAERRMLALVNAVLTRSADNYPLVLER